MLGGRAAAESPDDPLVVEAFPELAEGGFERRDGGEAPEPEELLLQGADEPLDAAVAFGLPDEGRAGRDPDGTELVLEGVADELAAVVVAEGHALRDADVVSALGGPVGLAEALDGLEAGSAEGGPHAEELSGAVVDEDEDGGVALVGHAAGGVDGPHAVGPVGGDGAVVDLRVAEGGGPLLREEAMLSHEAEDPSHRGEDAALVPQAGPDLAIAFADEGSRAEHGPHGLEKRRVAERSARPAFTGRPSRGFASVLWRWTVARQSFHALQTRWMP